MKWGRLWYRILSSFGSKSTELTHFMYYLLTFIPPALSYIMHKKLYSPIGIIVVDLLRHVSATVRSSGNGTGSSHVTEVVIAGCGNNFCLNADT